MALSPLPSGGLADGPASLSAMISGFDHLAITVSDPEATASFYERVLGARILWLDAFRQGRLPVFSMQLGTNRINVHPATAPVEPHATAPMPGSVDLCLRWRGGIDAAVERVESAGVAVEVGPVARIASDGAAATSIYLRDPDDNLVELLALDDEPGGEPEDAVTVLTTTRAVRRRLELDRPVEPGLIRRCIEIALQAPSASDRQSWHFVVVTDPERRAALAEVYRDAFAARRAEPSPPGGNAPLSRRTGASVMHLVEHLHRVPALVVPCVDSRIETMPLAHQAAGWASILPAVWSFMLAGRAHGLGTVLTTVHLDREAEAAAILGIPRDEVTQAGLVAVGHTSGQFRPAARRPVDDVVHWDGWGGRGTTSLG